MSPDYAERLIDLLVLGCLNCVGKPRLTRTDQSSHSDHKDILRIWLGWYCLRSKPVRTIDLGVYSQTQLRSVSFSHYFSVYIPEKIVPAFVVRPLPIKLFSHSYSTLTSTALFTHNVPPPSLSLFWTHPLFLLFLLPSSHVSRARS